MSSWGLCGLCLAIVISASQAREFTNVDGQKMMADPVSVTGEKVIFQKANGKRFSYALSKLSEEDQAFLKEWAKTSMKYDIEVARAQAVQFDRVKVKSGGTDRKVEYRGFELIVKNGSRVPVENIVCCYSLFPKLNDKYAKDRNTVGEPTHGKVTLETIPAIGETSFKTKPVRLESVSSSVTSGNVRRVSKWRESLDGGNFNFYVGERLIASHSVGAYKSEGAPTPEEVKDDSGKDEEEEDDDDDES